MNKCKVLVTGSSGYIGRHVVSTLLNMGYDVFASDFQFAGVDERAKRISPVSYDDVNIYEKLSRPDICIHLAWKDGFKHNSHAHIAELSNHYLFIKNMLDGGLKHIVMMGTMHEVGYWEGQIDENTPTKPLTLYGIAKNCLRQSSEILARENNAVYQWLRAFYILGDDMKNHSIFTKISQMEADGEPMFPFNTGRNKYDFIDVDELSKQIASAAVQEEVTGIINCCSGKPISLAQKAEEFITKNNYKIKLNYGQFPDRSYDSPAVWGDNSKITNIMNKSGE